MSLKRTLGLPMLTFYGTGMILGAGIYSIIGQAAGRAGEGLWQGFVLAALVAFFTALSYAELATMFPMAGGEYLYLRNAFSNHRWVAATTGILVTFAGCATAATVALAFSSYLQHFVEAPHFLVAISLLAVFTLVNIVGIRQSSWVNALFTVIEVGGLILFIYLGWQSPTFGDALATAPKFATVSSAALIIFAYFGFENIVSLSEETKNPEKTVPKAIFLSLAVSTVLYILVSLAAVALMSPDLLAQTESPLTDAAMKSSAKLAGVLGGIALFSTANTALIALIATSRILYGISKDKSLPMIFSKTLPVGKTPWIAALAVFFIAAILLPLGKVETVASVSSVVTMVAFLAVNTAVITLRLAHPKKTRPFRIPGSIKRIPVFPVLGIVTSVVFLFQFDAKVYAIAALAAALSAGAYLLYSRVAR